MPGLAMNAPDTNHAILRHHVATIEAKHAIEIIGLLPRGSVGHVDGERALDLLAERKPGLTPFGLASAEADLAQLVGRPVGIVLVTGLKGQEAIDLPRLVTRL